MKKIILIVQLFLLTLTAYCQVSFNGNIPYSSASGTAWDGISADCNISVIGSTTQNGVSWDYALNNIIIKSLRIKQKDISSSQIPLNVTNGINSSASVIVSWDLYVNNTFIERMGGQKRSNIDWARLQGLPNSEGYKPAVKENGHKLYNSGAVSIRNVKVENLRYQVDQTYYDQIGKEITGTGNNNDANPTSGNSTNVSIESSNSQNNSNNPVTQTETATIGTTTVKPLDNYDPGTGLYTNPMTNTNSNSSQNEAGNFDKGYEQGEQIVDITTGIFDLFAPSTETLEGRSAEVAEAEKNEEYRKSISKDFEREMKKYLPAADAGNQMARMILILGHSYCLKSGYIFTHLIPNKDEWIKEAVLQNNFDAMCFIGHSIYETDGYLQTNAPYGLKSKDDFYRVLEKAANLGSVDAMYQLALYFNSKSDGNDAVKALYWMSKAAENGNPKAMYRLGNIYRFRRSTNRVNSETVKYDMHKNEEIALSWYLNACANLDYDESLYYKYTGGIGTTDRDIFYALYDMYNRGIGCVKNKTTAEQYLTMYKNSKLILLSPFNEYLNKYVGVYKGEYVTAKIYIRNYNLYLFIDQQPEYMLEYYGTSQYQIVQLPGYSVKFNKDANNKVNQIEFIQPDGIFKATRIE